MDVGTQISTQDPFNLTAENRQGLHHAKLFCLLAITSKKATRYRTSTRKAFVITMKRKSLKTTSALEPNFYNFEPHICKECLSRIASSVEDGVRVFTCSNCSRSETGDVTALCVCGIRVGNKKTQLFRCVKNEHKTLENPVEYVSEAINGAAFL